MEQLQGKKVAVLVTDGFEQAELLGPKQALEAAGVKVDVISNKPGQVQGFQHTRLERSDDEGAGRDQRGAQQQLPAQVLAEKEYAERDGERDAELVHGGHAGHRSDLQRTVIA